MLRVGDAPTARRDLRGLVDALEGIKAAVVTAKTAKSAQASSASSKSRAEIKNAARALELAEEVSRYAEVVGAWRELEDVCAVREAALETSCY